MNTKTLKILNLEQASKETWAKKHFENIHSNTGRRVQLKNRALTCWILFFTKKKKIPNLGIFKVFLYKQKQECFCIRDTYTNLVPLDIMWQSLLGKHNWDFRGLKGKVHCAIS